MHYLWRKNKPKWYESLLAPILTLIGIGSFLFGLYLALILTKHL